MLLWVWYLPSKLPCKVPFPSSPLKRAAISSWKRVPSISCQTPPAVVVADFPLCCDIWSYYYDKCCLFWGINFLCVNSAGLLKFHQQLIANPGPDRPQRINHQSSRFFGKLGHEVVFLAVDFFFVGIRK